MDGKSQFGNGLLIQATPRLLSLETDLFDDFLPTKSTEGAQQLAIECDNTILTERYWIILI
jgi:hypothetical protein